MFLRFVLLGFAFITVIFLFDIIVPKMKIKYRLYKKLKEKKQKQETFRKKMQELEIKWISNSLVIH